MPGGDTDSVLEHEIGRTMDAATGRIPLPPVKKCDPPLRIKTIPASALRTVAPSRLP